MIDMAVLLLLLLTPPPTISLSISVHVEFFNYNQVNVLFYLVLQITGCIHHTNECLCRS